MKRGTLIAALFFTGAVQAQQPFDPDLLWTQAALYRDEWGTPHVYADNFQALGFAFGYAQAEDHLEPMLLAYRMANGSLSAVLGEAYAEEDAFALTMNHARVAQEVFEKADPVTSALCTGFAQGVNRWIVEHPNRTPPWAEGVKPQDVLALWHAFLMSMAPLDLQQDDYRPAAPNSGNAWALQPSRTVEGKTVLVINPHEYFSGPFRWYEAHLVCDGMNVAGATLFGLPVILQGHNEVLGWALTPNRPDTADVFLEEVALPRRNPNDPRLADNSHERALMLLYLSQTQPYHVKTPQGMETRQAPSMVNARGPVFALGGTELATWRLGGFLEMGGLWQLVEMARAQDLSAFQGALAGQQIPCFHVVYADQAGNVFYLYNATTGVRALPQPASETEAQQLAQIDWKSPLPLSLDQGAWGGIVPVQSLPAMTNPDAGFIQACGNPPWTVTEDSPIAPDAWPPWFVGDTDSLRAARVRQLLRTGLRSFRDNQSMLYDVVVPAAVEMTPLLLQMADRRQPYVDASHPDLKSGLELLRGWNYVAETNAPGMTFYAAWWANLRGRAREIAPSDAGLYAFMRSNDQRAEGMALDAAAAAAMALRNDWNAISVPWGEVHRITRGQREEPLFGASIGEPVFTAADSAYRSGKLNTDYGYGFAMAVQFGEQPQAVSVSAFGASEMPDSPHYADQMNLILEKRFKNTHFQRGAVLRYAESARGRHLTLYPLGVEGALTFDAPQPVLIRLHPEVEAPAPLPNGLVPFSLFVTPEILETRGAIETSLDLIVSETLCDAPDLDRVALYAHTPETGWVRIEAQRLDPRRRLLSGRHAGVATVAILGPEDALRTDPLPDPLEPAPVLMAGPPLVETELPIVDPPQEAPRRKFVFEWLGKIKPNPEKRGGRPTGQRVFKIERLDKKGEALQEQSAVEESPEPTTNFSGRSPETPEEKPQGKRKFKIERLDQEE